LLSVCVARSLRRRLGTRLQIGHGNGHKTNPRMQDRDKGRNNALRIAASGSRRDAQNDVRRPQLEGAQQHRDKKKLEGAARRGAIMRSPNMDCRRQRFLAHCRRSAGRWQASGACHGRTPNDRGQRKLGVKVFLAGQCRVYRGGLWFRTRREKRGASSPRARVRVGGMGGGVGVWSVHGRLEGKRAWSNMVEFWSGKDGRRQAFGFIFIGRNSRL
jgi:hypothetical protein